MPIREVNIYDRPSSSFEDMLFEDPANRAPAQRAVWVEQMQQGEFALFCTDGKTGVPRTPKGAKSGVCFVSADKKELREYGRAVVKANPSLVCLLRTKEGRIVGRIQKPISFWLGVVFCSIGTALVAGLSALGSFIIWLCYCLFKHTPFGFPALSRLQWVELLAGGLVVGIAGVACIVWVWLKRKVRKLSAVMRRHDSVLSPDQKEDLDEIERLMSVGGSENREEARQRWRKYQGRMKY